MLALDRVMSLRTSRDLALLGKAKLRETEGLLLAGSHSRRHHLHPHLLCLLGVLITPIKGIGKDLGRGKTTLYGRLKGRDKRVGITLTGRLQFHMSDQVEGLISFLLILMRAVRLHHLHLIALPLMPIIGGIRVGWVL